MGNPFVSAAVNSYNANPPPDDGSQGPGNMLAWSTIKTKLPDPIKSALETDITNTNTAFSKIIGGGGFTSTATNYTVLLADQGKFIKVTAAATITTPDATSVGSPFVFAVVNETTGDITIAGNNPGVQQNIDGAVTITVPANAGVFINTDGTNWFTAGQNSVKTQIVPQGRLTLVSGTPIIASDQTAKTAVFYTPYNGNQVPIPNGTKFNVREFSELTLTLASQHTADNIFDVFLFLDPADNSTVTIGTGPAWTTATAGSSARGTGAGTTELFRLKGLYVNNVAATMRNGATTYSVALKSAIYVGSIYIDHTAGQVSCYVSYGQNRKWGVSNAFNRRPIVLQVGDATASWTYATATVRASNNVPASYSAGSFNVGSGTACNGAVVLNGLAEEYLGVDFTQYCSALDQTGNSSFKVSSMGLGVNSITTYSGINGIFGTLGLGGPLGQQQATMPKASHIVAPSLGLTVIAACEKGNATASFTSNYNGDNGYMLMAVRWMG